MSFKLDLDKLVKDELEIECKLRGIFEVDSKNDDMRRQLRSCLELEKEGKSLGPTVVLDPDVELPLIGKKLQEIRDIMATFSGSQNQIKRIESKFAHVVNRLDHVKSEDSDHIQQRSSLLKTLMKLIADFHTLVAKTRKSTEVAPLPADPMFFEHNASTSNFSNLPLTSSPNLQQNSNANSSVLNNASSGPSAGVHITFVPVYKWGLKFSGSPNESFNAFLEEVEEYRKSRGVSKDQLFLSARELFCGNALRLYNLFRQQALDWEGLVRLMKEEFVPDADALWKQILTRTQGNNETIGLYVAIMSGLFDRMPVPVPEALRMQVLMKNILPFYQERLILVEVKTPFELIELCRKIEHTRTNIESFRPPKISDLTLEPDLSYVTPQGNVSKPQANEISVREIRCWRCNKFGHSVKDCQRPKHDFKCFGCGKMGFTKRTCPQCKSKQAKPVSDNTFSKNRSNSTGIVANNFSSVDYSPGTIHNSPGNIHNSPRTSNNSSGNGQER